MKGKPQTTIQELESLITPTMRKAMEEGMFQKILEWIRWFDDLFLESNWKSSIDRHKWQHMREGIVNYFCLVEENQKLRTVIDFRLSSMLKK